MIIGKAISPFALRKKNGGVPTDPDAQLFITATGITGTNATATNKLVIDLKAANIWTKMKAVYPMVGGTATTCKFNLKNPVDSNAAYRLTFFGGGTFSANGYLPNGTNAYADTFFIPSTTLTINSSHMSYYSRTNYDGAGIDFGSVSNPGNNGSIYTNLKSSNTAFFRVNTNNTTQTESSISVTDSRKFHVINRSLSTTETIFINGVANNVLKNSSAQPTIKVYLGCANIGSVASAFGRRECAFSSIGDGLSDAEALAFYNAVQTFNTTLGRQV